MTVGDFWIPFFNGMGLQDCLYSLTEEEIAVVEGRTR
jgi:hypothetical protein